MNFGAPPARLGPISMARQVIFKPIIVAILIASLVLMNVLTLLSDRAHSAAFGLLEGVLASVLTDAALSRVTGKSPTVQRKSDVVRATKPLSDRNNQLLASRTALQTKHDSLEGRHRGLDAEHKALTTRFKNQSAKIADVSKRLATRTIANATRNTASLAGEAIPIIGTTLVVGVTALDIKDACETLKDSNALSDLAGQPKKDESVVCGIKLPSKDDVVEKMRSNWKAAYASAATTINIDGSNLVPDNPLQTSWKNAKESLCTSLGDPVFCR